MSASAMISFPCTVCCKPTSRWCTRCQAAWYCSTEHMTSDWARHKKECVAADGTMRASPSMPPALQMRPVDVTAVVFVPDQERPVFQVISCQASTTSPSAPPGMDGAGWGCPVPLIQGFFPAGPPQQVVLTQGLNNETLRYPLQLWYCPAALARRGPVNRAIEKMTQGKASRTWCGPVVVLKYAGSRRQGYADATTNDLPSLSAYFLAYK